MNRRRVIKPLIKFNSLAIYIGVGFAALGRNALAKGTFKYDLTKLDGELRTWTEMVLSLYFFFLNKLLPLSGMSFQLASLKQ